VRARARIRCTKINRYYLAVPIFSPESAFIGRKTARELPPSGGRVFKRQIRRPGFNLSIKSFNEQSG